MSNGLEIPFDRVTYRAGQLLTASDLRDDVRRDARLRWLHTRTLHDGWGIALGLDVHLEQGHRAVVVGPGYAVDHAGRDLVLAEAIRLPVPEVAGPASFVLALSYQDDAAFRARRGLAHLCSSGLDPRHERPLFAWQRPDEVRFGPQVPLVYVAVTQGTIQGGLNLRVRRYAHPLVRPHAGWGATEPGRTGWTVWQEGHSNLGLQTTVDTSEAGFIRTPYYFGLLQTGFDSGAIPPAGLFADQEPGFPSDNFTFITDATVTSFTCRLITLNPFPFQIPTTPSEAEERRWSLVWLGLEPVTGCEPVLDVARLFALSGHLLPGLILV